MAYEPIPEMAFVPEKGLEDKATYVEKPATQEIARENIQRGMNQIKTYINTVLLPALYRTVAQSSGADQIGSNDDDLQLGATTVYGQIAALKALYDTLTLGVFVLSPGQVGTTELADGAVTSAKLAADVQAFDGGTITNSLTVQNTGPAVILSDTNGTPYYIVSDAGGFSVRLNLNDSSALWPLLYDGVLKTKGSTIWHTGNLGFGTATTNMARGDHTHSTLVAGSATDTAIGNRTVTDTTTPTTVASTLTAILGMFGHMIKTITGEASWVTDPDATIASIVSTNTSQQTSINTLLGRIVNKITVGTVAPTAPAVNDVWIDTN